MAIVRLDKITGNHLSNGRNEEDVMLNGYFVALRGLIAGQRETYAITAPADVLATEVLLHASPEVMYDPRQSALEDFYVEIGEECRLYHLTVGDVITLTEDLFLEAPDVGDIVSPQVDEYKLGAVVEGARLQFEVIEATTLGYNNQPAYALRVISA